MESVPSLDPTAMPLDAVFPPNAKTLQRTGEMEVVSRMLAARAWLLDGSVYQEACDEFQIFAEKCKTALKQALDGLKLPFPPLPENGPRVLPVLHKTSPNLEGWNPLNGRWQVAIREDAQFVEIRYGADSPGGESKWTERPLGKLFVPPAAVISALHRAITEAIDSKTALALNAQTVIDQCRRGTILLDILAAASKP